MEIVLALIIFAALILSWFMLPSTGIEKAAPATWTANEKLPVGAEA